MPYFPVKAAAEAGAKILAIFEKYGNITELGYTEEYAKAHNLNQDLDGLGTEVLTAANFTPWYEALTTGYAQFTVLRESKLRILLPSLVQRRKHARLPKKHTTSS